MPGECKTEIIVPAKRTGKSLAMKIAFARYLTKMKPGQKAVIISHNDRVVFTRNTDQLENKCNAIEGSTS